MDVGTIFLQRGSKAEGTTLSATSYQAPKDAKKAYEKGLEDIKKEKLDDAQKQLEKAVQIYPQYAIAWQKLGNLYDQQKQTASARKAYEQAITADPKYVPPYISIALIEASQENWKDVVTMTQRSIDLDPLSFPVAYYLNSLANYRLNNLEAAEKGARNAERYDQQHRMPQVHLLLGSILSDNKSYSEAITEYSAFLKLVPDSKDAAAVRARVTNLEKLAAANSSEQ
jgi:tetratricopeptide (TPR) repeat protein